MVPRNSRFGPDSSVVVEELTLIRQQHGSERLVDHVSGNTKWMQRGTVLADL